jgi:hypothetical protein
MRRLRRRLGWEAARIRVPLPTPLMLISIRCRRSPFSTTTSSEFESTTKLGNVGINLGNNNSPMIHQPVYTPLSPRLFVDQM